MTVQHEMTRLKQIEDRAQMKVKQLESGELEGLRSVATPDEETENNRKAYIRALRFALGTDDLNLER